MHGRTAGLRLVAATVATAIAAGPAAIAATHAPVIKRSPPTHATPAPRASVSAGQPNLVYILLDDLDALTMDFWAAMPYAKQHLADEGVTFTNAFAPMPICCPSRAAALTGKYAHNTGVVNNYEPHGGWGNFRDGGNEEHTVAVWLHDIGYKTAHIGKYMNGIETEPLHRPPGWDEWDVPVDEAHNSYTGYNYTLNENGALLGYGEEKSDYFTDVVARKARSFIEKTDTQDDRPFLMFLAPTAPHQPLPPARRHQPNQWQDDPAPEKPNYNEPFLGDKPTWLRQNSAARKLEVLDDNTEDYRNRMGSLMAADDLVRGVMRKLNDYGELDDTVIVFTSDNGYMMGAHGTLGKGYGYEESIRVPEVIRGPDIPHGTEEHRFALTIDTAPTFADLAGLSVPPDVDGRSLRPLLQGLPNLTSWREDFMSEYLAGYGKEGRELSDREQHCESRDWRSPSHRTLRNQQFAYIEWNDEHEFGDCGIFGAPSQIEYELYDITPGGDSWQQHNLLATEEGQEEYRAVWDEMKARLRDLEECAGQSCW